MRFDQDKLAEGTRKQSEERFLALAQAMRDVVWIASTDGPEILFMNQACEDIYGRPASDFYENSKLWHEVIHTHDRGRALAEAEGLFDKGRLDQEYRILQPNGEVRWVSDRKYVMVDGDGQPSQIGGIVSDITRSKEAQDVLSASEARHRALIDSVPDMMFRFRLDGTMLDFKAEADQLVMPPEKIIGRKLIEMDLPSDVVRSVLKVAREAVATREMQTLSYQLPMPNGLRAFEARIVASGSDEVTALVRDFTETNRAEESLRRSEHELKEAQRVARLGSWSIDLKTQAIRGSHEFYRLLDLDPATFDGQVRSLIAMRISASDRGDAVNTLERAIVSGEDVSTEVGVTREDGTEIFLRAQAIVTRDETGQPSELAGTVQDITERKQAELEREALIADLERRNAEMERFTYTVSHDLKSPLVTIRGFLGLLSRDIETGNLESTRAVVQRISDASEVMTGLLDDLLDLARVGHACKPSESVPLREVAQEAVDTLGSQISERGVEVEIAEDLPAVWGDRTRLYEAFQNLLDNAIKFTADQKQPRVQVGVRHEKDRNVYYVSDNGIGIPRAYQGRVFDLFERLNPGAGGTGIGLALVKRIVELHAGEIWVEPGEDGHGTKMCFTLAAQETATAH